MLRYLLSMDAMSDIQNISVALTSEQFGLLEAAVDAGEYTTTSEIVREAIRDWQHNRELRRDEVERLRRLWDEGKAGGPSRPFDMERTLSTAKSQGDRRRVTRIRISPVAERDLEDIWLRIAVESEVAATKILNAIGARVDKLGLFPRMGPRRGDIQDAARMLVEGFYLILYETQPDSDEGPIEVVEIVRVVDGRRDLSRL